MRLKSDLIDKIEMQFLPSSGRVDAAIWVHYMDANEKAWRQLRKNAATNIEQVLQATPPQSSSYTATYYPSRKLSKLDESDMQGIAGEVGTSS